VWEMIRARRRCRQGRLRMALRCGWMRCMGAPGLEPQPPPERPGVEKKTISFGPNGRKAHAAAATPAVGGRLAEKKQFHRLGVFLFAGDEQGSADRNTGPTHETSAPRAVSWATTREVGQAPSGERKPVGRRLDGERFFPARKSAAPSCMGHGLPLVPGNSPPPRWGAERLEGKR